MSRSGNRLARRFSSRPGRIRQSHRLRPRLLELLEDRLAPVADFGFAFGLGGGVGLTSGVATVVDGANNVYVTGQFQGTVDFDPDPAPGAVYNLTSAGAVDAFVAKYDGEGRLIWARRMGGTGDDRANGIAVSSRGEVNVTGEFSGQFADFGNAWLSSGGLNDVFVTQLDAATGDFLWTKGFGGTGSDRGYGVAVDNFGDVYLTGHFDKTVDFDPDPSTTFNLTSAGSSDIFVARFRSSGQLEWARAMGGRSADIGYDIAVDLAGNIVTTGTFAGTADFDPSSSTNFLLSRAADSAGATDAFVSKLDSSGNFVWAGRIGGTGSTNGRGLVIDGSNNIILTGAFSGEADFDPDPTTAYSLVSAGGSDAFMGSDAFVAKLAPDGKLAWAASFSGDDLSEYGLDVAVDAEGNVYSTGSFISSADFDPSPDSTHILTSPIRGAMNAYVSKLGPDGRFVWARQYDGDPYASGFGIAVDGVGNVYTTGYFTGTVDFDPDPDSTFNLTAPSGAVRSMFLAKLTQLQSGGVFRRGASVDGYATDLELDGVFDTLDTTETLIKTSHYPPPSGEEARGLIEFSLAGIDPSATVVSATLSGYVWTLAMNSAEPWVDVDIYGYAGDGALSLADASAQAQLVGQIKNAELDAFAVTLDPAFIQSLLGKADFVGLSLRISHGGQFFIGGSEMTFGDPPTLALQLEPASTNQPPVTNDDVVTVLEDGSLTVAAPGVLGNDRAPAGGALTATLLYDVTGGSLDFRSDGSFTYVPPPDAAGIDRFTYRATDGQGWSRVTTVTIQVVSVNDAPRFDLSTDNITVDEDASWQFIRGFAINMAPDSKAAWDEINQTLTFEVDFVTSGGLKFTEPPTIDPRTGDLVFRAAPDTNGVAIVTARLRDNGGTANGGVDSFERTFTITVNPINDAPTATGQSVTTPEDTPKPITLIAEDIDGDDLIYTIVAGPLHGTLSGAGRDLVYTPNADYNGSDEFSFRVSDGELSSYPAYVSITITPVNDAPAAADQSVATDEDAAKSITLVGSDVDGNRLTYTIVAGPSHGTLSGAGPDLIYTPNADYNGLDGFTFQVSDGVLTSAPATVSIKVSPVNDAPTAVGQSVATDEDAAKSITLGGLDVDGDVLTYVIVAGPLHGSLSGEGRDLIYTPNAGYNGSDSFTFQVSDGSLASAPATVFLTIKPVNDAPTAAGQSVTTDEDAAKSIMLGGLDVDGDSLIYTIVAGPLHGSLSGAAPNLIYTPNADYNGPDSFTFRVSDGSLTSNLATVSITIAPVNDAPTASDDAYTTAEGAPLTVSLPGVLGNDADVEGDNLSALLLNGPAHGTLSLNANGSFTYTPDLHFSGTDLFTYQVSDGRLASAPATVTLTVHSSGGASLQADAGVDQTVDEGGALFVSGSGAAAPGHVIVAYEWDFDYDGVTFNVDASGANASTSYPDDGEYTIALRVRDDGGQTAIDTLKVLARNVAPSVSLAGSSTGVRGQTLTFNGGFTDPGARDTHATVWQVFDDGGQVVAAGTGTSFDFVPTSTGAYAVWFTVTDDDGGQGSASQAVTVTAWGIQPDPCDPSKTALVVGGTLGDDQIVINPGGGRDGLKVIINGVSQDAPTPTGRVIVLGQAGNDNIQVAGGVKLPTLLVGGPGDDRLKGGNGVNVLIGGPGIDQLNGNKNDLLIPDAIDLNDQALCALLDEWASANPDSARLIPLVSRGPWTNAPSSPADTLPSAPVIAELLAMGSADPSGRGKKKS